MDPIGVAAASGIRARMESLEILANNLANSTTAGFKADRELYASYAAPEAEGVDGATLRVPDIQKNWVDFSQGPLQETGKQTDLGLSGKGFFVVKGANGPLYTRAGSFRISSAGALLAAEGQPVLDTLNRPIQLQPNAEVRISGTGEIFQNGATVAQMQVVDFAHPEALVKQGHSFFTLPAEATARAQGAPAQAAQIYQGYVEAPNTQAAESAVRMVHVLRQFESLQRALAMTGEMNRKVLDEVAKANG